MLWDQAIDLLRALIMTVAQVCNGSLGAAVVLVTLAIRLALLPLTLRLARRALAHQRRLADLKPEVERLRRRHAADPAAQWRETAAFYERRGVKPVDGAGLLGGLVQVPVFGALFAALRTGLGSGARFLWIGDLARPDVIVACVVAALAAGGMVLAPPVDPQRRMLLLQVLVIAGVTAWFLSGTSALFGLSSGAGSMVSLVQAVLLRRTPRRVRRVG
jgi:YidC/Oxa1 family membrane protein insertase